MRTILLLLATLLAACAQPSQQSESSSTRVSGPYVGAATGVARVQ